MLYILLICAVVVGLAVFVGNRLDRRRPQSRDEQDGDFSSGTDASKWADGSFE
ncbi:hypothetical protein [Paractinoplanes lichenicola]|uniref:Uncharacterized protein n=1 Tax=Paractinoplanes lichenicola TaxID=2802976 RepID=A0ABS1VYY6_9ACTN|nr:hypothetical protein [Actinoplanes lichenicola]MBL7259706.1 hypothetical protein [Actinoplanes lichenicola]